MPTAIEEFLRFYAPVTMARLVKHDMDYLGCPMKEYDWLMLGFPAANRDPAAFKDADKFIIDRLENRHLAFGLGIHRCVGSNLARLELRVAIEEFIARYPRFDPGRPGRGHVGAGHDPRPAQPAVAGPGLETQVGRRRRPEPGHPRLDVVGRRAAAPPRGCARRRR